MPTLSFDGDKPEEMKVLRMAAMLAPADGPGTLLRQGQTAQVPIDRILKIEFDALHIPVDEQKKIRGSYEKCVEGLADRLKSRFGGDIGKAEEAKIFEYLSEVFRNDFGAKFDNYSLVAYAFQGKPFNCYSSSVVLADALIRAGMQISLVMAPQHVFLVGKSYAFQTTHKTGIVFPRSQLETSHPKRQELGVESFVYITYNWAGSVLKHNGRLEESIKALDEAIKINPNNEEVWFNKGYTLYRMGRTEESSAAFGRGMDIASAHVALLRCRGRQSAAQMGA